MNVTKRVQENNKVVPTKQEYMFMITNAFMSVVNLEKLT